MNQSAVLTAFIFAGFVLFITSRNRLPLYARILWGDKPASHSAGDQEVAEDENSFFGFNLPKFDMSQLPFNWDGDQ